MNQAKSVNVDAFPARSNNRRSSTQQAQEARKGAKHEGYNNL